MTGCRFAGLIAILMSVPACVAAELTPELSVKEIMNSIVTPATNTIWGAYQLETESQWQEVGRAATAVVGAANLLMLGGTGEGEGEIAGEAEWQRFNQQLLAAARQVLVAVGERDENALSQVGNDALYPPCESCHQAYQK
ncbi:MAG: hypothetical protein VXZ29_00805 [Pseudomonadota bacterium]|nr:hypothetical protein [Pseudomonadota bacterium]MEC8408540.1 hypothetical protein [Pseudomonadota bacterium]MEC8429875.1 hypothetical protein [Pseudomonadota bacterium]